MKLITKPRTIIIGPNDGDGGNRGNDVVQPPRMTVAALAEIVQSGFKSINARLDKVETTLAEHGEILKRHDEIFKRNNLH